MCHGARYISHFYCLAVEAGFYSDVVECLLVDPATWVRFPAGTGKYFRSTTMAPTGGRLAFNAPSRLLFSSAEMFQKPLGQTV